MTELLLSGMQHGSIPFIHVAALTLCMLGSIPCFWCRLLTFIKFNFSKKNLSRTLSECHTVRIQIRTNVQDRYSVGPDLDSERM